ncbi:hypothetical protein FTX61_14735 [Nitriliruptoraceae bacterium ZYF776]|nr:hypothetical protein [Profundirhabdus halotolerans]
MSHPPVFDVLIDSESLVGIVAELPTLDPVEANLIYEMALGFVHDEAGREVLQVVDLVVSVEQDIWHTVRAGWAFNGDWMWFTWHGDEVLVFSGQPFVADYGSLPIASFGYRPEGSVTTPDAFMEACRGFEADNQELLDELWGGRERCQALRGSS